MTNSTENCMNYYNDLVRLCRWKILSFNDLTDIDQISQDLATEVIEKAQRSTFNERCELKSWLSTIATNHCNNWIRSNIIVLKQSVSLTNEIVETISDEGEQRHQLEIRAEAKNVLLVVLRLHRENKINELMLSLFMSYSEISSKLDISKSAVKSRIARQRELIRKATKSPSKI